MDEENKQIQLDILNELRALRENSTGSSMGKAPGAGAGAVGDESAKSLKSLARAAEDADDELAELGLSSRGLNRAQIDQIKSAHEYKDALNKQAEALKDGTRAIKEFGSTLISQERGFAKYGKTVESLGDAVGKAASTFGPLGKAVGVVIQGMTKLGSMYMEQADRLLKANDAISQFGTAGSFTTKELMDMAHGAGVTSKNMDLLVNPIKSLGPNLMMLGKNTGDSVKAFADLSKISNQQREEYQRLGISQEQLLQTQADYVALQAMSGRNLKSEMKDRAALQQASLNYQDTLLELATLTGQDVESVKKKQQEAARAVEWQISQIQLENRARKLEAEGRQADADKLRKEAKTKQEALDRIAALGNETLTKGARQYLATGTISGEDAQALTRMGLMKDLEELRRATKNGADAQQATAKFQDAYNKKFGQTIDNVGFSAQHSKDIAAKFGMSEQSLENYNKQRDTNFQEESKNAKNRIAEAKKPGKDPAQDARAKLTTAEIEAGKAIDKLVGSINPLLGGFTFLTVAGTVAAAALMGLAGAAGSKLLGGMAQAGKDAVSKAMGAARGVSAAAPVASTVATAAAPAATTAAATAAAPAAATAAGAGATGAAGAASSAATALGRLAGPLTKLAGAAPAIGTVMSVGSGVIDAYQGIKKADKDLSEGKITKEEARVEKGEAVGGGTGTAIGGAAGAIKGAALGASIGSVVPVLGTAVGGIIGAALGGWLGSKAGKAIGEVAGGGIAKMTADADKEVDKAKKKSDAKDTKEETKEDKLKDKKDEIVKVSIVSPSPLPVSIVKGLESKEQRSEESKAVKTLGTMGFAPDTKQAGIPKASTTGTMTGMAIGSMLGPIGMLVGGLFGSKFNKPVEKKEADTVTPKLTKLDTSLQEESKNAIQKTKVSLPKGPAFDSAMVKESSGFKPPATINVKLDSKAGKDTSPFTIQKGIQPSIGGADSLSKQVKGMLDTTLPKSIMPPITGDQGNDEGSGSPFGGLSQASDELTDGFVRLSRVIDEAVEDLGSMSGTFGRFDMKLKKDLTRDIPSEVGDAMEDSLKAGVSDAAQLRRELSGAAAPSGVASAPGPAPAPPPPAPMPAMPPSAPGKPPSEKQDVEKNLADLKSVLMAKGEKDENYINAVLGNVMKETGGKVVEENLDYSKTSNERIRKVFGSRAQGVSDEQLDKIKQDPQQMGEFMYGSQTAMGKRMGNTEPGDGWKYRGRGHIGLTGKSNYAQASSAIFGDDRLVKDPDLLNDPKVAAEVTAWYMQKTKSAMKKQLGLGAGPMSQEQANQLATSQVAGQVVKRGQGYLGETLAKVDAYSSQVAGIKPSAGPSGGGDTAMASAAPAGGATKVSSAPGGSHGDEGGKTADATGGKQLASAMDAKSPKEQVEKAGLKVRPAGDVYHGGLLTNSTLSAAKEAQSQVPNFGMFTGLNDMFHQQNHPKSKHALGQGVDFTLKKMPTIEESKEIKEMLQKIPGVSYVANEYYGPPHGERNRNTTGPHFHFQTSAAEGAVIDGPQAGYPVDLTAHGREVIAPLQPNSVLEMLAQTPAGQQKSEPSPVVNLDEKPESGIKDLVSLNEELLAIMRDKFDVMIDKLSKSNETQDKLLQNARV